MTALFWIKRGFIGWIILAVVVAHVFFFGFHSSVHIRDYDTDGMNYVNVARYISAGKGITQPTLGFNYARFSLNDTIPTAFIAQAPLYPILIALLGAVGIPPAEGAFIIPVVSLLAILLLAAALAEKLYGEAAMWLSLGLLLAYRPLHGSAHGALGDATGIALVLLSLYLLVSVRIRDSLRLPLAGLAGGAAFASRYALIVLLGVGILFLLMGKSAWKDRILRSSLFAAGFSIPLGLIWGRNWLLTGAIMPPINPSETGLGENILLTLKVLSGAYAVWLHPFAQAALLGLSLLAMGWILLVRKDLPAGVKDVFFSGPRRILILWSGGYLAFLIMQATRVHFDSIDLRLVAPGGVSLVLLWAGMFARVTRISAHRAARGIVPLVFLLLMHQVYVVAGEKPVPMDPFSSERLTWIRENVSGEDLVIGDNTVDIPFFTNHPYTVSFSPFPYTDRPTYDFLMAYCREHSRRYRAFHLILRDPGWNESEWEHAYGLFFADLTAGRERKYPGIRLKEKLRDADVFEMSCLESGKVLAPELPGSERTRQPGTNF